MPHEQFDELAKQLATSNISRRRILRLLMAATLAGLFPFLRGSADSQTPQSIPTSTTLYLPVILKAPCPSGQIDCNGTCCEGTACCGGTCQTKHSNGVGQNYFDCNALGTPGNAATYNSTMANEAAIAATTTPGSIISGSCIGGASVICKQGASNCTCWAYSGSIAGYVHVNGANSTCSCPPTSDPSWN